MLIKGKDSNDAQFCGKSISISVSSNDLNEKCADLILRNLQIVNLSTHSAQAGIYMISHRCTMMGEAMNTGALTIMHRCTTMGGAMNAGALTISHRCTMMGGAMNAGALMDDNLHKNYSMYYDYILLCIFKMS